MISKKEFAEIINRLRDYNDLQNKINELFKNQIDNEENDFCNAGSICIGHETIVLKLLKEIFHLQDDDTLSWWIYEMDYGRSFGMGDFQADGVDIDLTTPEKLYDYLIQFTYKKELK